MNNSIIKKIQDLLELLNYPNDEVTAVRDDEIGLVKFILNLEDPSHLIGRNGEALKSVNYIVRKLVEKELQEEKLPNFVIDINDYYGKKIDGIKTKAKIIADRAASFNREIELEPMSAYDRLIVHSYLSNFPNIETESRGEGRDRHVVVKSTAV